VSSSESGGYDRFGTARAIEARLITRRVNQTKSSAIAIADNGGGDIARRDFHLSTSPTGQSSELLEELDHRLPIVRGQLPEPADHFSRAKSKRNALPSSGTGVSFSTPAFSADAMAVRTRPHLAELFAAPKNW
jgi:hypothetical protein